jgi:hypothetical protein
MADSKAYLQNYSLNDHWQKLVNLFSKHIIHCVRASEILVNLPSVFNQGMLFITMLYNQLYMRVDI